MATADETLIRQSAGGDLLLALSRRLHDAFAAPLLKEINGAMWRDLCRNAWRDHDRSFLRAHCVVDTEALTRAEEEGRRHPWRNL